MPGVSLKGLFIASVCQGAEPNFVQPVLKQGLDIRQQPHACTRMLSMLSNHHSQRVCWGQSAGGGLCLQRAAAPQGTQPAPANSAAGWAWGQRCGSTT
jgi:hypothetical protein